MNPSENCYKLIRQYEGCRLQPYKDIAGFLTVGYGHKILTGEQFGSITQTQAEQILELDTAHAAQIVNDYCQDFLSSQNKFDAICDAVFNLGRALFVNEDTSRTHFYKALIVGDYQAAAEHLLDFCHAGGEVVQGLLNRRKAEQSLFLTPDAVPTETNT